MYINLDKKYLEKNKKNMEKESIEEMGEEDGKGNLLNLDMDDKVEYEFTKGEISLGSDSDMGYISIYYKFSEEDMMEIVRYMQRKANKIKELIKLADE